MWDHVSNFHYTWYGNIAKKLGYPTKVGGERERAKETYTSTPIKIFFERFIAFTFVTHDCHDCQEHHA